MFTARDRLGSQASVLAEDLQEMGVTVRDAAQEKVGQVGDRASEYCEQGRDKVHGTSAAANNSSANCQ